MIDLKDLKKRVEIMNTDLENLKTGYDNSNIKIEDMRTSMGDIFELSARHEIENSQGSYYVSKFEAFDLNGLFRLAFPRKLLSFEDVEYDSQSFILASRTNKLAKYLYVSNGI
jgi:hypothetical protein